MADLNDFFAKKDKKKKGGKKFAKANTDVLAKNLEEKDMRKAEDNTKNYAMPSALNDVASDAVDAAAAKVDGGEAKDAGAAAGATPSVRGNDDEWLSYDDSKKDYSGLKIASLKVNDPTEEEEEEEHEINEEGEKVKVKREGGKPWNKAAGSGREKQGSESPEPSQEENGKNPSPEVAAPASSSNDEPAAPTAPTKSSYVPPHMRGGGGPPPSSGPSMMSSGSMSVNSRMAARRGNRAAPDINSEVYFPSLGGTENERPKGSRMDDFEEVRSGGSQQQSHAKGTNGSNRITTGNKFAALGTK